MNMYPDIITQWLVGYATGAVSISFIVAFIFLIRKIKERKTKRES